MPDMPGSGPSVAARHLGPALGFHQLRPAPVELAMIALAHAEIAGPGFEAFVEPLMPQTHLRVHGHATRDHAAAGAGALLPIVHVVLLECAGRAETANTGKADRFLDMRWGGLVGVDPGPHLGLVGAARMPDAEGERGGAEHREIGKGCADDRVDATRPGSQALIDFRADLLLIFQNLG